MDKTDYEQIPVILKKLHGRVRGFCCLGSDFQPVIVINADMSPEAQRKTYLHELKHIKNGDMWKPDFREYGDVI